MADAWLQCACGASGDMLLGALLDAGASLAAVRASIAALGVEGIDITLQPVRRAGMVAIKAHVITAESHHHRRWAEIRRMLEGTRLPDRVRERAVAVFERLAEAEGLVHGVPPEKVHFHEVGALDAIADIVGVCAAVEDLGLRHIGADTVAVGSGTVRTSHGLLPVPAPAVVSLLSATAATIAAGPVARELCTPTGAALLATLVDHWGPMPPMRIASSGTGAGTADFPEAPNVLRVLVGDRAMEDDDIPFVGSVLLEANVDDLDPRLWPAVLERLIAAGADDAWLTPVLMKKGRPAHTVSALTSPELAMAVRGALFRETSTIGVRETLVRKQALVRTEGTVELDGHRVRVKYAQLGGVVVNAQPEYDDLADVAATTGRPIKELLARAVSAVNSR
ncbi:nickel pincer cofactor biosynthesis protein LarC [Dactylosporangium fulvum]|uniref:Pyridinium-3,5-bisthiocarboxylic acid mononucleotide nickel insertion protein n=1 Tax=Dactylosporangium fulvum TaxID=53359 RepID=A0ABY5WBJ8_9ACTN|nr:nickel pincer cofactor biosynthesis protein LarC [Dactylosporangium fulvum]UWP86599.1 nickel pincer cofactor biosynthesis protein LarC [Dactylosporangium fulvum]